MMQQMLDRDREPRFSGSQSRTLSIVSHREKKRKKEDSFIYQEEHSTLLYENHFYSVTTFFETSVRQTMIRESIIQSCRSLDFFFFRPGSYRLS